MGTSNEDENELYVDLGNGMFEHLETATVTVDGIIYTPNCKLFKIVSKKQLENIVRRLVMILYSSSLVLDSDNIADKTAYDNIVKDVTEISSMLGILDEVNELLKSLVHIQKHVVVDDEGMEVNFE